MKRQYPKFVIGYGTDAWPNEGGPPTICRYNERRQGYDALIGGKWRPINAVAFRD